jgi:hypothetical protein
MAYERLSEVREKIKRADKHIDDLETALVQFRDTNPYSITVDVETETGKPIVQITKADPVPPQINLIAGDAIQNLRSSLDYLACALVRQNQASPSKFTEFPIFDQPISTRKLEARFDGKVKGMRHEVANQIKDIRPYQGGDNLLWRLHRLNIIDKHNMLVTVFGNITAVNGLPPVADQWNGNLWASIPGVPSALKQGDEFSIEIPGVKVDKNTNFFAEVVFNEPEVAEGYPVILALRQLRRRVVMVIGSLSSTLK